MIQFFAQYDSNNEVVPTYTIAREFLDRYGKDEDVPQIVVDFRNKQCPCLTQEIAETREYFEIVLDIQNPSEEKLLDFKKHIDIEIKKDFITTAIVNRWCKTIYDELHDDNINNNGEIPLKQLLIDRPHACFYQLSDQFYNKTFANDLQKSIRFDDVNTFSDLISVVSNPDELTLKQDDGEYLELVVEEIMKYNAINIWKWLISSHESKITDLFTNPTMCIFSSISNSIEIFRDLERRNLIDISGIEKRLTIKGSMYVSSLLLFDRNIYEYLLQYETNIDELYSFKFFGPDGAKLIELRNEIFELMNDE